MKVEGRLVARRELKEVGRDKRGEPRGRSNQNTLYKHTKLSKNNFYKLKVTVPTTDSNQLYLHA